MARNYGPGVTSEASPSATTLPDPLVVAICYHTEWFAEPLRSEALAALAGIDPRIEVVLAPYAESQADRTARGAEANFTYGADGPEIAPETAEAFSRMHVALALDLPVDIVSRAPNLRWVQSLGAGADQFGPCRFADAGVTLTSSSGANAVGIAEFAVARMLEHYKKFPLIRERQIERHWEPIFGAELAGKTLGLIGYGAITSAVGKRARAFDMRIVASRQSAKPGDTHPDLDAVFPSAELHDMLGQCDAVIAAVPDSPETRGLMSAEALAAMKPGGFFCNVGRGSLVDEPALIAALESGHLAGAALDVLREEPPADDDPIWTAPNTSLSFHNSSVPDTLFENVHQLFNANVERFVRGEPLASPVRH